MKKRYLLASMSVGGGHNALRDSFVATLRDSDPAGTQFDLVLFDSQNEKIPRFYEFAVHKAPWMQAMLYELGRFPTGVRVAVSANRELFREAKTALEQHKPDVVVCTHFLLSMMFARARKELGLDITLVSAIPDYGETTEIFCPNAKDLQADHYIAMDPKTAEHLVVARGLPKERVHLGGFNPRQAFVEAGRDVVDLRASVEKKTAVLSSLAQENPELAKVDPAKPTLVFLGGSAWTSKTLPVIEELLRRPDYLDSVNCVVVCGKNEAFLETMRARVARNARFAVLGFVTPRLMAQVCALADVPVLGSLAPASMHRRAACGLHPLAEDWPLRIRGASDAAKPHGADGLQEAVSRPRPAEDPVRGARQGHSRVTPAGGLQIAAIFGQRGARRGPALERFGHGLQQRRRAGISASEPRLLKHPVFLGNKNDSTDNLRGLKPTIPARFLEDQPSWPNGYPAGFQRKQ
jgi:UDP-N-acetylglucosamine:LPS N-acetylglucosamine transferase